MLAVAFEYIYLLEKQAVHLHEEMGDVFFLVVEGQAWACSEAQGRISDTATTKPCLATLSLWNSSHTCASQSSIRFILRCVLPHHHPSSSGSPLSS